jgi:hypothetical protein
MRRQKPNLVSEKAMADEKTSSGLQKMKGVRIRVLNVVMICLAALVALVFLQAAQQTNDAYNELETASNKYIASANACNSMKEASNYLTIQVRTFAATQNPLFLERYFKEAVVTQRRENAIHDWVVKKIKSTYVRINDEYRDCNFEYEGWVR